MEYHEEHRSWSICREQCLFAVFEIYCFLSKYPSRKKCSSSDLCIFCLLSSTKSVSMYLVTYWKYKQSHIFISPCRNDPPQLQNCRRKRFLTVFGTLRVIWRQLKEMLSPAHPRTECILSLFFASSDVSFGLIREALHRFNGCAKIWSAPGTMNFIFNYSRTLHILTVTWLDFCNGATLLIRTFESYGMTRYSRNRVKWLSTHERFYCTFRWNWNLCSFNVMFFAL